MKTAIAYVLGVISGFAFAVMLALALAEPGSSMKKPTSARPAACWRAV